MGAPKTIKRTEQPRAEIAGRWSALSDEQLLQVIWTVDAPGKLANLHETIPHDLGEFQIESEYHLPNSEPPVRCGHCTQHTLHRHGFVLLDGLGRRFLLGSTCGPAAYGADYLAASKERNEAERRARNLRQWQSLNVEIPNAIDDLMTLRRSGAHAFVKRARDDVEANAVAILNRLRRIRPHSVSGLLELIEEQRTRDTSQEEKRDLHFQEEVTRLANLPLSNKEHARRLNAFKQEHGIGEPIWVVEEVRYGTLRGAEWLLVAEHPIQAIHRITMQLRATGSFGAVLIGKSSMQMEACARAAKALLTGAKDAGRMLAALPEFFDQTNLNGLVRWYGADRQRPGSIEREGAGLAEPPPPPA